MDRPGAAPVAPRVRGIAAAGRIGVFQGGRCSSFREGRLRNHIAGAKAGIRLRGGMHGELFRLSIFHGLKEAGRPCPRLGRRLRRTRKRTRGFDRACLGRGGLQEPGHGRQAHPRAGEAPALGFPLEQGRAVPKCPFCDKALRTGERHTGGVWRSDQGARRREGRGCRLRGRSRSVRLSGRCPRASTENGPHGSPDRTDGRPARRRASVHFRTRGVSGRGVRGAAQGDAVHVRRSAREDREDRRIELHGGLHRCLRACLHAGGVVRP